MRRITTPKIARCLGTLVVAAALLGCGGGDDGDDASSDTTAGTDEATTTTGAPEDEETTTTAAPDDEGGDSGACPLSADEVSSAIGGDVQEAQDQVEALFSPPVVAAADSICVFSSDGQFTPPLVAFVSSDDPAAEGAARGFLEGEDQVDVPGVGDEAFGNGAGQLVFRSGDTWSVVIVAAAPAPSDADQAGAIAVAHLIGG